MITHSSCYATADYLKSSQIQGDVYVVGEKGIFEECEAVGIRCHGLEDNDQKDVSILSTMQSQVRTVIVGLDRNINYVKISRAASYIRDHNCRFIATNTDATYPNAGGIVSGGSGCIVSAISTVAGKQPDVVIGKPNRAFIDLIRRHHPEVSEKDILMTGDRLDTDILFANRNNIHSLCVLSGITSEKMIEECAEELTPEFFTPTIADMFSIFQQHV